jgi:hypothetical protein
MAHGREDVEIEAAALIAQRGDRGSVGGTGVDIAAGGIEQLHQQFVCVDGFSEAPGNVPLGLVPSLSHDIGRIALRAHPLGRFKGERRIGPDAQFPYGRSEFFRSDRFDGRFNLSLRDQGVSRFSTSTPCRKSLSQLVASARKRDPALDLVIA